MGNLIKEYYELSAAGFAQSELEQIEAGNFPIILAKDGVFTKLYVSEENLSNYTHWDALDSDRAAQAELHGVTIPIVWQANLEEGGMYETGIQHKVIESNEE